MRSSNLNDLAGQFKRARTAGCLTQREAAAKAGVSTTLLVSQFERGALAELGAVKLVSLLRTVGLELHVSPAGQQRTLNDIAAELDSATKADEPRRALQRVRHSQKRA